MYLWRAHNIVNNRLKNTSTEDPQFVKYQFPPTFLCPLCHSGGHFSRRQVRNFLLTYYTSIYPTHRIHTSSESGFVTSPMFPSTIATTLETNAQLVLLARQNGTELTVPFRHQQENFKDNTSLQRTTIALSKFVQLQAKKL